MAANTLRTAVAAHSVPPAQDILKPEYDPLGAIKGIALGVLLSIPLWAAIILTARHLLAK
jgi:hypothetical protein